MESSPEQEIVIHAPADEFKLASEHNKMNSEETVTTFIFLVCVTAEERCEEEFFPLSKTDRGVSTKRYRTEGASKRGRSPAEHQTGKERSHSSKEKASHGRSSKERPSGESQMRKSSQQSRGQAGRESYEGRVRADRHDYIRGDRVGGDRGGGREPMQSRGGYRHYGYLPDKDDKGRSRRGERHAMEAHSRRRSPTRHYQRSTRQEEQHLALTKEEKRGYKRPWSSRESQLSTEKVSSSSEESESDSAVESAAKKGLHDREGIDSLLRDLASGSSGMLSSSDSDSEAERQKSTKRQLEGGSAQQPSRGDAPSEPPENRSGAESNSSARVGHEDREEGEEEEEENVHVPVTAEEVIRRGRWYSGYDEELESSQSGSAVENEEEEEEEADTQKVFSGSEPEEEREEEEEEEEENKGEQKEPVSTPPPELPAYYPAMMGCRNVESYEWLNRIEEGTYGVVYRAKDKRTG